MKTSESQVNLLAALLAAQKTFPVIPKTKEGQQGNRKFKYAPLEEIKALCDPILQENGLMVTHGADGHMLDCRLDHISGEWRETHWPINEVHASDQAYGIETTYKKRYSYQGIIGVVTEEDTDGNARKRGEKPQDMMQPGVTVRHAVRDGIGDDLPEDWKIYLGDLAEDCMDLCKHGNAVEAAQKIALDKLDSEQRTFLENKMDSKTRAAIKAAEKTVREALFAPAK